MIFIHKNLRKDSKKLSKSLIALNAILFFFVSFLIGNGIAAAQIKYFDEPANSSTLLTTTKTGAELQAEIKNLQNRPTTAQYTEFKDQLSANIIPENPGSNQDVTINLEIYSFDINSSMITWKRNGQVISSGLGRKSLTFKTGNPGVKTTIDVTVDPRDRPSIARTFSFTPGEVDILWQADTYTPPFYKGKALFTTESSVTFVAMPKNTSGAIRPSETVYNWKLNDTRFADKSGYGKNTFNFEGQILIRPVKVDVETYTPTKGAGDNKEIAKDSVTVEPVNSYTRFYEDSLLHGVLFNNALIGNMSLNKSEVTIATYPFHKTLINKNSGINYTWYVDGSPVELAPTQNSITLRRKEGEKGRSLIVVKTENPNKIMQSSSDNLEITFDKKIIRNQTEFGQ